MSKLFKQFKQEQKRDDLPDFQSGDVVTVYQTLKEGDEEKTHPFSGVVIEKKGENELDSTFTVRTKIKGVGVERIFPFHSPSIDRIEVERKATRSRRSKHYWVRDASDKKVRKKLKWEKVQGTSESEQELEVGKEEEELEKQHRPEEEEEGEEEVKEKEEKEEKDSE